MANNNLADLSKIGAAARILLEQVRTPYETARSQIALLAWLFQAPVRFVIEESLQLLADAFVLQWPQHLESPALLRYPRISVPAIREAIAMKGHGASRLLALFGAASMASGITPPTALIDRLKCIERDQQMRL